MIFSPCHAQIVAAEESDKFIAIYMMVRTKGFLTAPIDGTLRVLERAWETICSVNSKYGNIVVIRDHCRKSRGPSKWIPRCIGVGESMGIPISIADVLEMRMPNKNLRLTHHTDSEIRKDELMGVYLSKESLFI